MNTRAMKIAALLAGVVLIAMLVGLKMRNHIPFVAALGTFFVAWLALLPVRRRGDRPALPKGEAGDAVRQLEGASSELDRLAKEAPVPDQPLFSRMSDLMARIGEHHRLNPDHAGLTAKFRKHVVGRMVGSVEEYVRLAARTGAEHRDRLAAISAQLEQFVPVLERIDQACLDNDLMALEINVEVLNDQLNRRT